MQFVGIWLWDTGRGKHELVLGHAHGNGAVDNQRLDGFIVDLLLDRSELQ